MCYVADSRAQWDRDRRNSSASRAEGTLIFEPALSYLPVRNSCDSTSSQRKRESHQRSPLEIEDKSTKLDAAVYSKTYRTALKTDGRGARTASQAYSRQLSMAENATNDASALHQRAALWPAATSVNFLLNFPVPSAEVPAFNPTCAATLSQIKLSLVPTVGLACRRSQPLESST